MSSSKSNFDYYDYITHSQTFRSSLLYKVLFVIIKNYQSLKNMVDRGATVAFFNFWFKRLVYTFMDFHIVYTQYTHSLFVNTVIRENTWDLLTMVNSI